MKKFFLVLVIFVITISCVSLVGCGGKTDSSEEHVSPYIPEYGDEENSESEDLTNWILPYIPLSSTDHLEYVTKSNWELPCIPLDKE